MKCSQCGDDGLDTKWDGTWAGAPVCETCAGVLKMVSKANTRFASGDLSSPLIGMPFSAAQEIAAEATKRAREWHAENPGQGVGPGDWVDVAQRVWGVDLVAHMERGRQDVFTPGRRDDGC